MSTALIILAAGESSRMGSPKALLRIDGETFLDAIVRKAREIGVQHLVVTTGANHEAISQHIPSGVLCIKNEEYKRGQISSVQTGIRKLHPDVTEVFLWPVDQPLIQTTTVEKLLEEYRKEGRPITVPTYEGRRGHPVLYNRAAMEAALNLSEDQTGKDLLAMFADELSALSVSDPGVLIDIDTPEDFNRYIRNYSE